ncbi:MAG: ribosomal L7Ae/L30e/S12e/Gadd45 family protein [Candidatus Aenigmarchaeota archaeon]|nr:ribosomal L7Ae/L30e/S12e/Gadd45 family protein [Candidatus Aenigmarchaeota archaeon]
MSDAKEVILSAIKGGKAVIGLASTIKAIVAGRVSAVFVSADCPPDIRQTLEDCAEIKEVPIDVFPGDSRELSTVCKKPFNITVISVVEKK